MKIRPPSNQDHSLQLTKRDRARTHVDLTNPLEEEEEEEHEEEHEEEEEEEDSQLLRGSLPGFRTEVTALTVQARPQLLRGSLPGR